MTTIVITGSGGQLGSELRDISARFSGYNFIFADIKDFDIKDPVATRNFIQAAQPAWVINCAAFTAVDGAEDNEKEAMLINGNGVENIVNALDGSHCHLIHISTDYVFDGKSCVPYTEEDKTSPDTVYGKSKLAGESFALSYPVSMVIRTSWLYSSYGKNFVRTILSKAGSSDNINVVFDQTGSPTYAADLASAIMEIISGTIKNNHNFVPGIFHYADEGSCSWYDLAVEIVAAAGSSCKVNAIPASAYPAKARRPSFSVLDKTKIKETYNLTIPHWRVSLNNCISKINSI